MNMGWLLIKTIGSLVLVLALMLALVYALKRWFLGGQKKTNSALYIDILAHQMLQPKKSIYVVRVLGKILVVGASENGLNSLASFDYNELEEAADTVPDTSGTITPTFFNFLKENIGIIRMKSISRSKKIL